MTAEERIKKVQLQCSIINKIIPKIDKYFIEYCKALKEIWKEKINKYNDFSILEKYGLGTKIGRDCSGSYLYNYGEAPKFIWHYEIKELNKLYKQCLR